MGQPSHLNSTSHTHRAQHMDDVPLEPIQHRDFLLSLSHQESHLQCKLSDARSLLMDSIGDIMSPLDRSYLGNHPHHVDVEDKMTNDPTA